MLNTLKETVIKSSPTFRDHMILSQVQPHTRPVEHLPECCSGVITAQYYFLARYFDLIDDASATAMVQELKKLQNTDPASPHFGCMRWYREETFITDTNGAFFVLLPLALTCKLCPEKQTQSEKESIADLLKNAAVWFLKATSGAIYYCNKIMSDGAMLALITNLTGKYQAECEAFWLRWHEYADVNGWGWGENSSDCYSDIMLNALNVTILATNGKLRSMAEQKREKLLDYIAFHNGREFIPSIRTYNFEARADYGGSIYRTFTNGGKGVTDYRHIMNALVIAASNAKWPDHKTPSAFRREHLFGDSYAYTWHDNELALGSISHFPVMPCSYQQQAKGADGKAVTWGLAWQSMPVSAMLEDKVGFLRIRSHVNQKEYSHPAVNKHNTFLYNRLFEDGNITVFSTISAQEKNIAIAVRYANRLANTASGLWDEWCMPGCDNQVQELTLGKHNWYLITRERHTLALCPLDGIAYGRTTREPMKISQNQCGNFQTISTEFYDGENKLLFAPRLESAWILIAIPSGESAASYLTKIEISDEELHTHETSLAMPYGKRLISCSDGTNHVQLLVDSVNQMDI